MNDIEALAQIFLVMAAIVVPVVAAIRMLAGWEPFDGLIPREPTWPTGVREEDPLPWNFGTALAWGAHAPR